MPISEPLMMYRVHPEQQVGVKKTTSEPERDRHARVAKQFEELNLHIVNDYPEKIEIIDLIRSKIDFLRRRARLPTNHAARLAAIGWNACDYCRYARGWRSALKDMTLS